MNQFERHFLSWLNVWRELENEFSIESGFRIGQMELDAFGIDQTKLDKYKKSKNNISKYKFCFNSNYTCNYCFENFKSNQSMCINSCYHYWCEDCNDKLRANVCGFCRNPIEPNEFINTYGEKGFFEKTPYCLNLIQIMKDDIDLIVIDDVDDIDTNNIDTNNINEMNLID
jgi:hypothetical protein